MRLGSAGTRTHVDIKGSLPGLTDLFVARPRDGVRVGLAHLPHRVKSLLLYSSVGGCIDGVGVSTGGELERKSGSARPRARARRHARVPNRSFIPSIT